ncbi:hypothetical protein Taro_023572 [Colocasia esculenta]|uniref:Uncharacterized protein n=1 Tax=Colocasia esculenta TaxID=4460 RepID=A0A843VEW9_COLES|nr:hypothetical protein [Colocasia esculenta]
MEFHSRAEILRVACVLVHRLSYPLGRTRIFVRPAIGTARKAPIQNRHFDPPTISPIPRFSVSRASLDYANHWRGQHTESSYHGDRKSCSTRLEISTTGRTRIFVRSAIGTTRKAPIQNRHFDPPMISTIPKFSGSSASLDYANRWRGHNTESAYHGDRKSCSTLLEISTPAKELGITFCPGIGIAYVTTTRNRHSESVGRALVSRNSVPGSKFTAELVSASLDYANSW